MRSNHTFCEKASRRRGSVLLMVVGLMTILALLGSTFLFIARSDRRTTNAMATKAPVEPLVGGIVARISSELKADLHIGLNNNGTPADATDDFFAPYTGASADLEGWRGFVDCPTIVTPSTVTTATNADKIDDWLASIVVYNSTTFWPHLTNLGDVDATDINNVDANSSELVNSDGDTYKDAKLIDSDVMTADGGKFYTATRVIDLSGLINVNTACVPYLDNTAGIPNYISPVNINLKGMLDALDPTIYSNAGRLNPTRCNGTFQDSNNVNDNIALRFFAPTNSYVPFAIGDELFLRWLTSDTVSPTFAGRLFQSTIYDSETKTLPSAYRRYLATYNCSRALVRRPVQNMLFRLALRDDTLLNGDVTTTGGLRKKAFYDTLMQALNGGNTKQATHLVANLWTYIAGPDLSKAFEFSDGANYTAYGVQPDLVITEALAKHDADPDNDPATADDIAGYAIEIFNPTGSNIDLANYKFLDTGGVLQNIVPASRFVNSGDRVVIYSFNKGADADAAIDAATYLGQQPSWINNTLVDFSGSGTIKFIRIAQDTTGALISVPVDTVSKDDLGYSPPSGSNPTADIDIQRDDNTTRFRYIVAEYASKSNTLGSANTVTDLELSNVKEGFEITTKNSVTGIKNIGELLKLFVTGPSKDGANYNFMPEELKDNYLPDISRGKLDINSAGITVTGNEYPTGLPLASLMGEFCEVIPQSTLHTGLDPNYRIFGKVNINTSPRDVIVWMLPDFLDYNGNGIFDSATEPDITGLKYAIADSIIAYRNTKTSKVTGTAGFMTPGELGMVLANYANTYSSTFMLPAQEDAEYLKKRDFLYSYLSNMITVNSDVYAVYVTVYLGKPGQNATETSNDPANKWNYLAVIDRSNCRTDTDTPAVLMFTELK